MRVYNGPVLITGDFVWDPEMRGYSFVGKDERGQCNVIVGLPQEVVERAAVADANGQYINVSGYIGGDSAA